MSYFSKSGSFEGFSSYPNVPTKKWCLQTKKFASTYKKIFMEHIMPINVIKDQNPSEFSKILK